MKSVERQELHRQLDLVIDTDGTDDETAAQLFLLKAKSYVAQANAMKEPERRANMVATAAVYMQIATFHQNQANSSE